MGIFDIFTNDAAKNAAQQNSQLYQGYGTTANNALGTYGTSANNIFGSAYGTGTNYLTGYGGKAIGAVDTGQNQATSAYGSATGAGTNAVDAYAPLQELATKYGGATNLYRDSLGVNGTAGNDRAVAAFRASPGYQYQVDQAEKETANKAASLGIAGSGNTEQAIADRTRSLADQDYGGWRASLAGFLPYEASTTAQAASGRAGGYGALAGIYSNEGNLFNTDALTRAGIYGNIGTGLAGLTSADAAARAGVSQNLAQGQTAVAGNVAGGLASANNAEAQAAQNGSATFWNGLFNLGAAGARAAFPSPTSVKQA